MCTTTSSIESTATFIVSQPPTTLTSSSLLTHTISVTCGGENGPACPVSYSVPATTPTSTPEVATTTPAMSASTVLESSFSASIMTTSVVSPPTYGTGMASTVETTAAVTSTTVPTPVPVYTGSGASNTVGWSMMLACGIFMVLMF